MTSNPIRIPDDDHPIAIRRNFSRVVIRVGGEVVADTVRALTLREATLPPVHYIPREDVAMDRLVSLKHQTYCPYKGTASYFDLLSGELRYSKAAWSYEDPHAAVAEIAGHIAFVSGQAACIEEWERKGSRK